MKREDYEKLRVKIGEKYTIKKLPKDVLPTWEKLLLLGRNGEVVRVSEFPYKSEIEITLKVENPLKMFGGNFSYLVFKNEEIFDLKKVVESKKKPKELPLSVEFDFGARITTLKTGKDEIKVKAHKDDTFDKEKGILLCLAKLYGYSYEDIKKLVKNAKEKEAFKFDLGTIVKVVSCGKTYDTYKDFVRKYAPNYIDNYRCYELPKEKRQYIVVGRGKHENLNRLLYVIKDLQDNVFVISEDGIEEI